MRDEQEFLAAGSEEELLALARRMKEDGCRLVQICAAKTDAGFEVNYSFDKGFRLFNVRITLPLQGAEVKSISGIYWSAFLYENEMSDLFGIAVKDIAVDYRGKFYRTSVKYPFGESK